MPTRTQPSTTEMQVTSIRLERSLIEKLKERAGSSGYQSLMRDVLWDYVNADSNSGQITKENIRTVMAAEARQQEQCALTGQLIEPYEEMWLAMTDNNQLVPLSINSLED
ncbi:MAG: BrnA antitoxin family protein [Phormidesmis sp. RL_2_1]|nr:BrnA antitoxin family protein [Phormidesmis sp. RL_2_1]